MRFSGSAPEATATRALLSESLVEQGRKDEALAVLQEGLKAAPDAPQLQRQMGSVLERSGRPDAAAAATGPTWRWRPTLPDANEIAARAAQLEAAVGRKP